MACYPIKLKNSLFMKEPGIEPELAPEGCRDATSTHKASQIIETSLMCCERPVNANEPTDPGQLPVLTEIHI